MELRSVEFKQIPEKSVTIKFCQLKVSIFGGQALSEKNLQVLVVVASESVL